MAISPWISCYNTYIDVRDVVLTLNILFKNIRRTRVSQTLMQASCVS